MSTPIRIRVRDVVLEGELDDGECAQALAAELPLSERLLAWGDEIHFHAPVELPLGRQATMDVHPGDVCYWREGRAVCIYFGPTPISNGERPVPPAPVVKLGRVTEAERLRPLRDAPVVELVRAKHGPRSSR